MPVELVHESERSRVERLSFGGRTVVRKLPLGPDAERALRHERALLERLRGVQGVAQLAAEAPPGALLMEDGGRLGLATPLPGGRLLPAAIALAKAVAGMHARGVMHRDIAPANVVVSAAGEPCLVGFGLATSLPEIRPEFTHHARIAGTLAYMAPEQTGRTGRSVDQRADLYSLGATLYDMATGAPPFGTGDPLRLTYDHLARVPAPPAGVHPALAAIVMRLLEKEPDRRYQSAVGVVADLERLRDHPAAAQPLGERDVPLRLPAPSRLVGRDAEVAALEAAFADGGCRGVLVSGPAGVGKTALAGELRALVTGAGGWFVAGKFDQYRRDLEFDAVRQVLSALGRLLLAEPEAELAEVRDRIAGAVGANASVLTATVPEFAALLGAPDGFGDPLTAQARAQRAAFEVLRAVVSPRRPLVVFVDDLQWAGRTPLGVIDLVLGEEPVDGLLLVAAYREEELDASRWRRLDGVRHVRLAELPEDALVALVAEMLRADRAEAAGLAELIEPHTRGNPYETLELLDGLRRDGLLRASAGGWRWDREAVRAQLGTGDLPGRAGAVPAASRELLETMACLGGRVELSVLQTATGGAVEPGLAGALDDGLLVMDPGPPAAVRFRHDRIREAILAPLDPPRREALQLALARRLAQVPELFAVAAEQYLPVVAAVTDPEERRVVVELLRRAAGQAGVIGDHALVDALLSAALPLAQDGAFELHAGRHAALFSLGRLEEADGEYAAIAALRLAAVERAEVTAVQVRSLTHRTRFADALELGLQSLRECGVAVPPAGGFTADFGLLRRWLDEPGDGARAEVADPALLAAARLIDAVLPVAYYVADPALIAWLGLEALRIWVEHGPSPALVGPVGHAAYHAGTQAGDRPAAYAALKRIVALGEASGYEPGTSQARHMLSALICWFEPIEAGVRAARRARNGLIAGADLAYAGYTYQLAVPYLADCAPTLERFAAEVESGVAFLHRTGDELTGQWLEGYQWLARVLRGERPAEPDAVAFERYAGNPLPLLYAHLSHALGAAVLGEAASLEEHSAGAMALVDVAAGSYATAGARLLRALALAAQVRDGRAGALQELDELADWLAERAADAPDNFLHVLRLIEAERAWATGDFRAAMLGFDAARREVAGRLRPWHRALITERAARFLLAHGAERAGYDLLAEARQQYLAWGATAKADRLDWASPKLLPHAGTGITTGTIDLLGILSAWQALSSETSIDRLHARVVEVLGAMTGATAVHLALWSDDDQEWQLPEGAAAAPLSVLRYARRSGEPLVVDDACRDERFARDPYFAGVERCSLLVVPVFSRGAMRAALVLENRLIRAAFSGERLDAVTLIAGQLAVSLDNALLIAELATSRSRVVAAGDQARRRIERDLHDGAQQRLVHTIITLKLALRELGGAPDPMGDYMREALEHAERANEELRELAQGIHPSVLTSGGLGRSLESIAGRSPIPVTLALRTRARLAERVEVTAYYVVSEALTNAAKHSGASTVDITLDVDDGQLRLSIGDDGVGGADPGRGSGLVGLKDRVEALGGTLVVHSRRGQGTRLQASVPLDAEAPAGA